MTESELAVAIRTTLQALNDLLQQAAGAELKVDLDYVVHCRKGWSTREYRAQITKAL